MREISVTNLARHCLNRLDELGLEVEGETSFSEMSGKLGDMGKKYLTPKLSPDHNDFTRQNTCWIFLMRGRDYVGGVGARLDDIGDEPLSQYWRRTHNRQYPIEGASAISSVELFVDQAMSGRLVYIGDLFITQGLSGSRSTARLLVHLLYCIILTKWEFDYTYSFVRDADLARAGQYRYGMSRLILWPQRWHNPPPDPRCDAECLLYSSQAELEYSVGALAKLPEKL